MKKLTVNKRFIAMLLAIITAFSACGAASVPVFAEGVDSLGALLADPEESVIPDTAYTAGIAFIRSYVPGGGVCTV